MKSRFNESERIVKGMSCFRCCKKKESGDEKCNEESWTTCIHILNGVSINPDVYKGHNYHYYRIPLNKIRIDNLYDYENKLVESIYRMLKINYESLEGNNYHTNNENIGDAIYYIENFYEKKSEFDIKYWISIVENAIATVGHLMYDDLLEYLKEDILNLRTSIYDPVKHIPRYTKKIKIKVCDLPEDFDEREFIKDCKIFCGYKEYKNDCVFDDYGKCKKHTVVFYQYSRLTDEEVIKPFNTLESDKCDILIRIYRLVSLISELDFYHEYSHLEIFIRNMSELLQDFKKNRNSISFSLRQWLYYLMSNCNHILINYNLPITSYFDYFVHYLDKYLKVMIPDKEWWKY